MSSFQSEKPIGVCSGRKMEIVRGARISGMMRTPRPTGEGLEAEEGEEGESAQWIEITYFSATAVKHPKGSARSMYRVSLVCDCAARAMNEVEDKLEWMARNVSGMNNEKDLEKEDVWEVNIVDTRDFLCNPTTQKGKCTDYSASAFC